MQTKSRRKFLVFFDKKAISNKISFVNYFKLIKNYRMKKLNKKGFTLIELLVVITIIGILATGAVSVFTTQLQGARDSTRIGDMKTMETALHQLFSDNSEYPEFTDS
jgi:prepilin-type N-terminal cleavage/methylation domain-containing protein